ncbi:hypothetical protein JST97_12650 [bacterium]|nr:hypothetical protein [bacterium]
MFRRGRKQGTAMLLVLFTLTLVVMFLGALMTLNQSSIRLATGLTGDKNATANCQSGLDFAWQMLERDSRFGQTAFANGAACGFNSCPDRIDLRLVNPTGAIAKQFVQGRYQDKPNSGFQIYISNNLASSATVTINNELSGPRDLPPHTVLVCVRGIEGTHTRVLESMLQKAPFVSHGLFAGDDVTVQWGTDVGQWDVLSNDPFRNSVRTKGKLTVGRVTAGGLVFSPSGNATASTYGRYGAALPSKGVFQGGTELDTDGYSDAARQSRGLVLSRSAQEDRIKSLGSDDLRKPDINVSIPGGVYRFEKTSFDVKIEWQQEENQTIIPPNGGPPITQKVWKDKSETKTLYARAFARYNSETDAEAAQMWLAKQHLPQPPSGAGIRGGSVTLQNEPNSKVVALDSDGKFPLTGTGGLAANINFAEGTFDIPANTMLTVDGPFHLQHRGLGAEDARPKVRLVNQTNPDDPNDPPITAGLRARGDLTIDGGLRGSGTVISDGKLEMYAESSLSASAARPVALYANGDVKLNKDDAVTEDRTSQATLGEDWTMFKRSIGSNPLLDTFLNDSYGQQQSKVSSLLSSTIKNEAGTAVDPDPDYYFSKVTGTFFPPGDPDNLTAAAQSAYTSMRSGGLTTDEAIRFREYCRQLAIDAHATTTQLNPETGEMEEVPAQAVAPRWLDPVGVHDEVVDMVQSQLVSYNSLVGQEVVNRNVQYRSLRQWFNEVATNPYENDTSRDDSVFRGLVYSRHGNFTLNANYNALTVIGALVVPEGKVNFNQAKGIKTVYDPKYLRDLLLSQENVPLKLDQMYWKLI